MATYQEICRFVGIIDRGLARFEAIRQHHENDAIAQLLASMTLISMSHPGLFKALLKKKTWQERAYELRNKGIDGTIAAKIEVSRKAANKISDWQNVKQTWLKQLNVSLGHDFSIRVISYSKRGLMVTVKHPSLKQPVTRHLREVSKGLYTGKAPFGAEGFVQYHVNVVKGELQENPKEHVPFANFSKLQQALQAA